MSAILRNTLRFIGTVKFSTNPTKNVQSTLPKKLINKLEQKQSKSCDPDNYFILKDNSEPISFFQRLWSAFSNQVYLDDNTLYITKIDYFLASVGSHKGRLITPVIDKTMYLSPAFNVKVNGESIEPLCTKIVKEKSFLLKNDTVSLSRKDGKFTLQKLDSGETVTFNHTIYLEAHTKQRQIKKGGEKSIPSISISDIDYHDTKVTLKIEGQDDKIQTYKPEPETLTSENKFKDETILEYNDKMKPVEKIKKFDLQFPMTVSLDLNPRKIHIEELGDTFNVYHKVEIQTSIELTENLKTEIAPTKEGTKSKIGKIQILLNSGDLLLRTPGFFNNIIVQTNDQVWITVDFDSPVPSINFYPTSNTFIF